MSLQTPTTKEVSDTIIQQLQTELNQSIPLLPKSFMRVLAKVLAGIWMLLYKYGGYIALQMFVSTAGFEDTEVNGVTLSPLIEWGRLVGASDPIAAVQAELAITVTVNTQGSTLPSGTQLVGEANGVTYITTSPTVLNAPTVSGYIRAMSDQIGGRGAGEIGNLSPGGLVSFANPLGVVSGTAEVTSVTVVGTEAETSSAYRGRVLERFQKRPQGGAYSDYELWGRTVDNIAAIYPYTSDTPGQVDVYVEATYTTDGIPTPGQLTAVAAAIELNEESLATRRPAGALVNVLPITRTEFTVDIDGVSLSTIDDLGQLTADLDAGIKSYFLEFEPFIVGVSVLPRKDRITNSGITGVAEDIISAVGGVFAGTFFDLASGGGHLSSYTLGPGEKAKVITVTVGTVA